MGVIDAGEPGATDDEELYLLWLQAETEYGPVKNRAKTLSEYATRRPDEPRWRDLLRDKLSRGEDEDVGWYLSYMPVFPDYGSCAVPEVLRLTASPDYWVRTWSVQYLVFLLDGRPDLARPEEWVDVLLPRLQDAATREKAQLILRRTGWKPEPVKRPKKPRLKRKHRPDGRSPPDVGAEPEIGRDPP